MQYWVETLELWAARDREVTWHGRPDSKPVVQAVGIPGTDDALVLLDPESGPRTPFGQLKGWPHLVRVRPDGQVVWRIEAGAVGGEHDWWTGIDVADTRLWATTYSGYHKELDPNTGRTLASVFTK
jgi:hypothetical protein